MVSKQTAIINKSGLHARPASELVKICSKCSSDIVIKSGDKRINPKSILSVMAAAVRCGTDIIIECTGENEKKDLDKIVTAIASGLGE